MDPILRRNITTSFKLSGLTLRAEARDLLAETLGELEETEREDWLEKIIDFVQRQPLELPVVERHLVETAILDSCKNQLDDDEDVLLVISAFQVPVFKYMVERKKFLQENGCRSLFDSALSKGKMFRKRYDVLLQLTLRNPLFNDLAQEGSGHKLRTVESLLSGPAKQDSVVSLGLLAHLKERYYLEDPSGIVPLDLSSTSYHDGLFVDGSLVLAEGSYCDGVLSLQAISLPPREPSDLSRTYFGPLNYFGGPSPTSLRNNERLKKIEGAKEEAMFVFLSDVWLDQPDVLERLDILFNGYSSDPPYAFVLMGDFQSTHKGHERFSSLREGFKSLGELLAQYPALLEGSRFIILPGPSDSTSSILPRAQLPEFLLSDFTSVAKHVHLATNPCRIRYCTQEIVIMREDLVTKLCRNTLHYPTSKDIGWHFARTLLCQTTLVPLSLNVCPVYWSFSPSLDLYPSPDLLVVGDRQKPFTTLYNKCNVINPGSFSKGEFTFKVYYPASKTVDDCQVTINNESIS